MIFSLGKSPEKALDLNLENTDIFCFFKVFEAIELPSENWFFAVAASLKMKRNVLILEAIPPSLPELSPRQRIVSGPEFLWLAPHALSVLIGALDEKLTTYTSFKSFLSNLK